MNNDELTLANLRKLSRRKIYKEFGHLPWSHGMVKIIDAELNRRAAISSIRSSWAVLTLSILSLLVAFSVLLFGDSLLR